MKVRSSCFGTSTLLSGRLTRIDQGVPVLPMQRDRDKLSRAYDTAPFVESGNVLLCETAPWLSGFLAECEAFPSGAHDDQLDPMFDAVRDVQFEPVKKTTRVVAVPMQNAWTR